MGTDLRNEAAPDAGETMLTDLQKRTAQAIVNLFETGQVRGDYGRVTLIPGDPGHLTYGRSQTTLASGTCTCSSRTTARRRERPWRRTSSGSLVRWRPATLRVLLPEAGQEPGMSECRDHFFDRVYWNVALP